MRRSIRSVFVAIAVASFAGAPTASWSAPVRAAELAPRTSDLSPNPSSTSNTLTGVSGVSATDAWAVGDYTDDTTGATNTLILHWDGTSWSHVASPNPSSTSNELAGVSATSATDAWAVGDYKDDTTGALDTLILHWDGTSWSQVTSPNPSQHRQWLGGVSADSATDAWAVGYRGGRLHSLILHWDGTSWSQVTSPNPSPYRDLLAGVTTISATDAWTVGWCCNGPDTLILHWNGAHWSKVRSPNPTPAYNILQGVSADSTADVWAVGSYGQCGCAMTLHWDGTSWSQVPNSSFTELAGVSATGPRSAWVGEYGQPRILRWDGTSWSQVKRPKDSLVGVFSLSNRSAWAVGSSSDASTGVRHTLILHWDGTTWSQA
jgi:hypothetical protein